MTVVHCPIEGSYVVYEKPLPIGQTPASGIAVYDYGTFWSCEDCGGCLGTTKDACNHIKAVQAERTRDG